MELPLGGPALRHYTQSRPRPHRQKLNYRPSRPQETIIESENEVLELIGRVDEGVEEFFTKRVLPADTLKRRDEDVSITVQEVAPASATPGPPPAKTLRRKLGDFFTLRKRRGLKSETSQEGRPKRPSMADLIRPLREVARAEKEKDKEKVKESCKENEKEKEKEDHSCVTVRQTASSGPPLRGDMAPPKRALREGKSQSLILLSGSTGSGTASTRHCAKKQYEGQHSFEQKLHLMLQRIGVSKAQPGEIQNQGGEMKKAESEGTIIDSKPDPAPSLTKPRTMSTSSDTRHQMRPSASAHESTGKPALLPKPVIKPGPPPATAGRSTPESELAEKQEGDTAILSTQSPTKNMSSPTASNLSAPQTNTEAAVPTAIPDLTNGTTAPTSTVILADTDILCTACADPYITTVSTSGAASVPITSAITPIAPTCTSPASPTTPATTPTTATGTGRITTMSSDPIASNASMTSSSAAMTSDSIATPVTLPSDETSACLTSSPPLTSPSLPVLNGAIPSDTSPTAITEAVYSVTTTTDTMSSFPAGTLNTISDCPPAVITDVSTSITVAAPTDTKIASFTPDQTDSAPTTTNVVDAITARFDTSEICPVSAALPSFSTSPTTGDTASLTLSKCKNGVCTPAPTDPFSTAPTVISVTSTSSTPLPVSTDASNLKTFTCSTSNSTRPASVHFPLTSNSAPASSDSRYTVLLSSNAPSVPIDDSSSTATLPDSTRPMPSSYSSSGQALQTAPEGNADLEPTIKGADGKGDIAQNNQQNETEESWKDDEDGMNTGKGKIKKHTAALEKEVEEDAGAEDKAVAK